MQSKSTITMQEYKAKYDRIYSNFIHAVEKEGLEFAPDNEKQITDLKDELRSAGAIFRNNDKSIYLNKFSKACADCATGCGSNTFIITLDCNRDCYFCTNRNQAYPLYKGEQIFDIFREFDNYAAFADKISSVAVTGGEPLIYADECAAFFKRVKTFGSDIYTRLYTNGDYLNEKIVANLAPYLDEIRISVKDNDGRYDLSAMRQKLMLCTGVIPHVTVEMPVLPESVDRMKELLDELEYLRVFSINLLEFLFPAHHPDDYIRRGFRIKHRPYDVLYQYSYPGGLPVDGSELAALECIKYAAMKQFTMGLHYCSLENKLSSQIYQQNIGTKLTSLECFDKSDFFIKSAKAFGADAQKARAVLDNTNCPYYYDADKQTIEFRICDIPALTDNGVMNFGISYCVTEGKVRKHLREIDFKIYQPQKVMI